MSKSSRREADTLFGAWCAIQSFLAAIFFSWGAVCFSDGRPTGEEGLEGWLHAFRIPFRTVFATAAVNGENSTPLSQPYDISYHSWKSARQPAGVLWVFHYLCYIVCCTFSSANVWRCCIMAQALWDVIFYITSTVQMGLGVKQFASFPLFLSLRSLLWAVFTQNSSCFRFHLKGTKDVRTGKFNQIFRRRWSLTKIIQAQVTWVW